MGMRRIAGWVAVVGTVVLSSCSTEDPPVSTPRQASQAKVRYDRSALVASLETLGLRPVDDALAEARVRERLSDLPCAVPDEVALLFAHQAQEGSVLRYQDLRGFPASRAEAAYDSLRQNHRWRPNWIPIMKGDGGWLAVESSRGSSPAGPVLWVADDGRAELRAINLTLLTGRWSGAGSPP